MTTQQIATREAAPVRGNIYDRNMIPLTERTQKQMYIDSSGKVNSSQGKASFVLPQRYESSALAAHIIGYIKEDGTGVGGIEELYDSVLATSDSYTVSYVADAVGRPRGSQSLIADTDRDDVCNIKLTLDYHIQKAAEEVMDEYIPKGAVVILDVQSFDVVAMASRPSFNPQDITSALDSDNGQLLNRALCQYNAGSVFKIAAAASVAEANPGFMKMSFWCDGTYELGTDMTFVCNKADGHGLQSTARAFADSCNCAFYACGEVYGGKCICTAAQKLGLGLKHLEGFAEESTGFVPVKDYYTPAENANLSIGQGEIMITPLQCAVMTATVANKGQRKAVNIAECITDSEGNTIQELRKYGSYPALTKGAAMKIGSMMRECVLSGTAKSASSSAVSIAGKTGSAETGWLLEGREYAVHGWFCGFFPYENPRYAMAVLSENGKSGAGSCVEPFVKICEEIDKIYPMKQ